MATQQLEQPITREAQNGGVPPDPTPIFDALNKYQQTMTLKGAIDLDLFTHIGRTSSKISEIAERCETDERATRILCDYLTVNGFLLKEDGAYRLTPNSAIFLDKQSPAYIGSMATFIAGPESLSYFRDVAALVRQGGALDGVGVNTADNRRWVEFARTMAPLGQMLGTMVAKETRRPGQAVKVLDIASGHGMFGISAAHANPQAQIYAADWENVLEVARENARIGNVSDRFHTLPGDAFSVDFGSGYDLVLLPNFLHHFDFETNVGLLKKIHAALKPGGQLATVEFVPNDDRVSPPVPASFSILMLANTVRGDAYTFRELSEMFEAAGFGQSTMQPLAPTPLSLILTSVN